ncbi:MAG: DNA methyltransferase [Anaerolineae bacterium]
MLDSILQGDCIDVLNTLPQKSVDVVFADPPYNMQLTGSLFRPNLTRVDGVDDEWDKFESLQAYDDFTRRWLVACRRVLKNTGTLWVIGSYHNIYRVGAMLLDTDYWVLNEIVWHRINAMPNFNGTRFNHAHETLIWAQKIRGARYTFNYHAMKNANDDKQMRSVWDIPICSGSERIQLNGEKAHTTQKPEALLYRVLVSSTKPGDVVLDPFFGTGTTGAVAKRLRRHWIGIERDAQYAAIARQRIDAIQPDAEDSNLYLPSNKPRPKRVPFIRLLEEGLLQVGQTLRLGTSNFYAQVTSDGSILYNGERASIHKLSSKLLNAPSNGWTQWHFYDERAGQWQMLDILRQKL